jgi:hypothetical protein
MRNPNSGDISKDNQQPIRETNHVVNASSSAFTNTLATSQELHLNQASSNPAVRKMSPGTEPRRRYRSPALPKVILTQPESTLPQQDEKHHISGSNSMEKPPTSSDPAQILAEIRKCSLVVSSRGRFQRNIVNRRVKSEGVDHLSIESLGENSQKPSSETSRSTASGSTGSTSLEPFRLEDLPLRIKLAEGLLTERPGMQRVEIRRPTASTITVQNSVPVRPHKPRLSNPSPFNMEMTKARYTRVRKHELVLKFTNFSLTSLGYRYGDIRVQWRPRLASDSGANSTARSGLTMSHASRNQIGSRTSRVEDGDGLQDEELDLPDSKWQSLAQLVISGWRNAMSV